MLPDDNSSVTYGEVAAVNIVAYQYSAWTHTYVVVDSAGAAVNLAATLKLVVSDLYGNYRLSVGDRRQQDHDWRC